MIPKDESHKAFDPRYTIQNVNIIEIKAETDKAWLLVLPLKDTDRTVQSWFPKKVCSIKNGKVFAPKWLIDMKNKENGNGNNRS